MDQNRRKFELRTELDRVREKTLRLLREAPAAYFNVRVHDFYSPIGWHFGHVGMTEELWTCVKALNQPAADEALTFLFANLPDNPKDNRVHIPDRSEIEAYLELTRCRVLEALNAADLSSQSPLIADGYAWEFALQHECQHQETIAEMLQLIQKHSAAALDTAPVRSAARQAANPVRAVTRSGAAVDDQARGVEPIHKEAASFPLACDYFKIPMASLSGGVFTMGSDDPHGYDNEKRAHAVEVAPFQLDAIPVTVSAWLAFIEDCGYERPELWAREGWEWRTNQNVTLPEYWRITEAGIRYCAADGFRVLHPDEPVSSLSWYEADAFARWAGKRLPTEAEWEFAAAYNAATGNSRRYPWGNNPQPGSDVDCELHGSSPRPVQADHEHTLCAGSSEYTPEAPGDHSAVRNPSPVTHLAGSVWEWTSSPFLPYPGFEAFPYDGYSKEHMDGKHFVCRGGSWATDRRILRCAFRNWYVPTYRQGFLGVRCAGK